MNQSKPLLFKTKATEVPMVLPLLSLIRVFLTLKIQQTLILHQHLEVKTSLSKLF
jgi:hypothetical protein